MNGPIAYLRVALSQMLVLLALSVGDAIAVQIEPNPNPAGNEIFVQRGFNPFFSDGVAENHVQFSNFGFVGISPTNTYLQTSDGGAAPRTINAGSFSNSGTVQIGAGTFFDNTLREAIGSYHQFPGGTTQIDGGFSNSGHVNNEGTITVGRTGTFSQIQSPTPVVPTTTNSGILTNEGKVVLGGEFNNSLGSAYLQQNRGTTEIAGTFNNSGLVRTSGMSFSGTSLDVLSSGKYLQEKTGTTAVASDFKNFGSVQIAGNMVINCCAGQYIQGAGGTTRIDGTLTSFGSLTNIGAFTIGAMGEYFQKSDPRIFGGAGNVGTYTNEGKTVIEGGVFANWGRLTNSGIITVTSTGQYESEFRPLVSTVAVSTNNSGNFVNEARVTIHSDTIFNNGLGSSGSIGLYDQRIGGTTQIDGGFVNSANVKNAETITVGTTGSYVQTQSPAPVAPTTMNSGHFINQGSTLINAGTFTNLGTVENLGTFQVAASGQVLGTGSYNQTATAAQTIVNGTFAHNITLQAGTLTGTGTIQGAVQNSGGLLLPGNNGLGTLTIKGQYAQGFGGTFGVNLAGLSSYGLLAVQGTGAAVTLGGSLQVGLLNGFSPSLGNTFGILTCTGCTISGGLRSLSLPTLASGLDWSVGFVNGLGMLQLAVVSVPTASAPEPDILLLVGAGFVGLVGWRRKLIRSCFAQRAAL